MKKVMIVCGYGKMKTGAIVDYVKYSIRLARREIVNIIIYSGGDTTDESNGSWKTEAEMLMAIKNDFCFGEWMPETVFLKEEKSYNTLTNILYSIKLLADDNIGQLVVVCNRFHLIKTNIVCLKICGLRNMKHWTSDRRLVFCAFPLTKRASENIKILLKTIPETLGYFIRPIGRRLEYLQYQKRTGRNEQINFWQFCVKFIPTGELF